MMVKVRRPETAPFLRYFRFCNVLRLWSVRAIPTYRVYRLYDKCVTHQWQCYYLASNVNQMNRVLKKLLLKGL